MKKSIFIFLIFVSSITLAQNDCVDAIVVCGNSGYEDLTATGVGIQELFNSNTCGANDTSSPETNSLWLNVSVNTGGTLGFILTPTFANGTLNPDINIDFDFYIFGPNVTCGNIGQSIRCSTTNPAAAGQGNNLTGIDGNQGAQVTEGPGADGNSFVNWLAVNPGDSYFIVIDRPIGSSNFRIDWIGTATFNEPPEPTPPPTGSTYNLEECDTDGVIDNSTNFDLTLNTPFLIGSQTNVVVTYHLNSTDAQVGVNAIINPTNYANTSNAQIIYARIENINTGCFSFTNFEIEVTNNLAMITTNIDIEQCDDNNDDLWNFDLTQNDMVIIDGQPNTQVSYHESEAEANFNSNPIVGLYQNTSNSQIIWARLENISGCYGTLSFQIQVYDTPIATAPPTMILCDDDNNGTMPFDLTVQDSFINTAAGMTITYHPTQTDADNNTNPISSPFEGGNTTIFARVENDLNTDCYDTTSFDVEVYDSAFPIDSASMTPLDLCDDTSFGTIDDGIIITDLTVKSTELLNGQSVMDFDLTYFTDSGYTSLIVTPTAFQNTIAGGQPIYVRMTNVLEATCFTNTGFELAIFEQPEAGIAPTIILCDDDNNGTMPFNLTQQDSYINTVPGMTITYHLSQTDADVNTNPISSPFESGNATIYARVENDLNTNCFDTSFFDIEVYDSAFPLDAANILDLSDCDNISVGSDIDGYIVFNLTVKEIELRNGQSATDFTLTYFTDATYNSTSEILNPGAFINTDIGGQTIYVRMTNNLESSCYTDTSFEIEVFELPILNTPPFVLEQCDIFDEVIDGYDGISAFNLTEINEKIVSSITTEVFTYYESEINAINATSPIPDPLIHANSTPNTDNNVWVRIENENECFRTTPITLIVNPSEIPLDFLVEFFECDAGDDTTDGIATFDFSSVTPQIEAYFPTIDVDVYYYESEADATSEINEIDPSNHQNTNSPNTQEIWVRAESQLGNDCLGNGQHVTLTVHPLPQFEVESTAIVCLNLPPITLETFNANGVYTYVWTDEDNIVISTDPTVSVSSGGKYSVVANYVTSSGSSCQSEVRVITVSESIIATINLSDVTVTDDSDNNTITIDTTNLGIGDYEFALDDEFGIYQDEPYFDMVTPGLHMIYVRDKNDCGITPPLEVSVIGFPNFFTPNNDGENDYWQIKGVSENFFATSLIYVYDRFGKMIATIDPTTDGWDGYYNGEALPSTDYWFTAQLIDQEGNVRDRKGHFSLIRR